MKEGKAWSHLFEICLHQFQTADYKTINVCCIGLGAFKFIFNLIKENKIQNSDCTKRSSFTSSLSRVTCFGKMLEIELELTLKVEYSGITVWQNLKENSISSKLYSLEKERSMVAPISVVLKSIACSNSSRENFGGMVKY